MCEFNVKNPMLINKVVGYKVALKYGDKYYSPVTGIEYKVGKKVTIPTVYKKYAAYNQININDILEPGVRGHLKCYKGLTAIFEKIDNAEYTLKTWKHESLFLPLTLLKMELSGRLFRGDYGHGIPVYLGSFIESIKEM
jgi:hypothetical protein